MKHKKPESENSRENYARRSEEVPFFPFRPVSMTHIEMDPIEQLQYDFVQQAGQPGDTFDDERSTDK